MVSAAKAKATANVRIVRSRTWCILDTSSLFVITIPLGAILLSEFLVPGNNDSLQETHESEEANPDRSDKD